MPDTIQRGKICFQGFGQETPEPVPFAIVPVDPQDKTIADGHRLVNLLSAEWKLGYPNLIISVTGGAKDFQVDEKLLNVFKKGLVKAAASTGAWIITGGTHDGVMKVVGEAVREYKLTASPTDKKLVALGVATFGIVDGYEKIRNKFTDESEPLSYHFVHLDGSPEVAALDHNHTHFLLADDGTEKEFGGEILLRAELQSELHKASEVPAVVLVLEGGPNTIKTAAESVDKKVPLVIFEGSGRAADLIAHICKHKSRISCLDDVGRLFEETVKEKLGPTNQKSDEKFENNQNQKRKKYRLRI